MKKLKITNFKSIAEKEINTPNDESFSLKGHNGAGKSAVIEAVQWALQGNKHVSKTAIKKGETQTEVILETDAFTITRKWTSGKNPTLNVTDKTGKIFPSPQGMLDEIVSNLSFDPTDFITMKPDEQLKALRGLIDPDGEIAKLESEKSTVYDQRTIAGREVKRLQGAFDTLPYHKDAPEEEVSSQELVKQFDEAKARHTEYERLIETRDVRDDAIAEKEKEIEYIEKQLDNAKRNLSDLRNSQALCNIKLESFGELPNLDACKLAFEQADETNKKVRANRERRKAQESLNIAKQEHEILEKRHEKILSDIDRTIKSRAVPVDGLTFGDIGLMLNGIPFGDCSDGERLNASLLISMSLNKGLRMIAIKNGSLLDDERKADIMRFAKERGFQVIMEIVESGELSVEIEVEN